MSVKVYQKAAAYAVADYNAYSKQYLVLSGDASIFQERLTVWSLLRSTYGLLQWLVASSTSAGMILPVLLILAGLGFIYTQIQPSLKEEVASALKVNQQGNVALVPQNYIESNVQYVSNPGLDYFKDLTNAAKTEGVFVEDTESMAFNGTFYITIPKLRINRMPIQANVDSSKSEIYKKVLDRHLAHFRGTSLPFVNRPGNMVIYGHSVGGSYSPRPNDVVSAFTFLRDLKVGDEIIVELNGKTYKYLTRRSDIVEPQDTSILASDPGREALTLFTCYPPGSQEKRLVIKAVPSTI
jgi:LPXTG-site transpeptidase (sortase) family protein